VVVVEEENTTREIKRLKSAVAGVMAQIEVSATPITPINVVGRSRFIFCTVNPQGIARTAEQRHQLIKRMEPLAEENKILREALSLSEKSIQRAHRERDLAESNSQDLKHQNGILSERLTASSKQLKRTSEELAIASEELKKMSEQLSKKNVELDSKTEQLDRKCQQLEDASKLKSGILFHIMCFAVSGRIFFRFLSFVLAEQDAELNRLRQTVEQIRQEKTKESNRADKLAEELKGRLPLIGSDAVILFLFFFFFFVFALTNHCNSCRLST